jgi:hypothetical protein
MTARNTNRKRRRETGIALLISIFVLLLISVVAIALIVSSGTESALAGNYRSSTGVYYAALSGLEEARGRLLPKNPSSFKNTAPGFLPAPGTTLPIGSVAYVLNPGPTDAFGTQLTTYPDAQYDTEFGAGALASATVTTTNSVWNRSPLNSLNLPGPLYKWVRINAVSEKSMKIDVDADGLADSTTPLYYDGAHFSNSSSVGPQVLEITSFALLPNGSQKFVQYLVASTPVTLPPFPAALTLAGSVVSNVVSYTAPPSNNGFWVKGIDQDCSGTATLSKFPAIGVFDSADIPVVTGGIPSGPIQNNNYPGSTGSPDIEVIYGSFSPGMRTPAGLDAVMQSIIQNADAIVPTTSPSAQTTFLSNLVSSGAMSSTSPLTVVVNGDLDLTGWHNTGYGLLLVTGSLTYDPDAYWNGIVMVVGQGQVTGSRAGSGEFDGAMLVARTHNTSGVLLSGSNLGTSSVNFNAGGSMGGTGIRYSNCWIQKSQPTAAYKILSFHEITQ